MKRRAKMFSNKYFLDKDEGGVISTDLASLGPVQRSLGSDFPEPEARFMPKLKLSKKSVTKKRVTKKSKNKT